MSTAAILLIGVLLVAALVAAAAARRGPRVTHIETRVVDPKDKA